jgi:hypothetical protein
MARTVTTSRTGTTGRSSITSRTSGVNARALPAHLMVYLEMLDVTMLSAATTFTSQATQMSLDTSDYDGSPTYSFQVVMSNADNITRVVQLLDSSSNVKATLTATVGAGATLYTTSFTPNSGYDIYRVSVDANSSAAVTISTARIVITQTLATKTRIQIPLTARNNSGGFSTDAALRIDQNNTTSYTQITPDRHALWQYVAANWATLNPVKTFTFAAVVSSSAAGATSFASLFNATSNQQVVSSQVSAVGTSVTLQTVDFTSDAEFTNNSEFEVRYRSSNANNARIHRSALYIRIYAAPGISFKGESYARILAYGDSVITTIGTVQDQRQIINHTTGFSNATVTHEVTGRESVAGVGTSSVRPFDTGVVNVGTAGTAIGTAISLNGISSKTRQRASVTGMIDGDRYVSRRPVVGIGSTILITQHLMVISWTS